MKFPVTINGHQLTLHTSGAAFLEERKLLLIADVHLGKVMHFRRHGLALPPEIVPVNFQQLTAVANLFAAETICFLGDLFHSGMNSEWALFEEWSRSRNEQIVLVTGNHDVLSPKLYTELGIDVRKEWQLDDLLLTHVPEEREGWFTICGHVHPGVKLYGPGRQSLKLPCFFRSETQLILPAFGAFTGKYVLRPSEKDTVYAIAGDEIVEIGSGNATFPIR